MGVVRVDVASARQVEVSPLDPQAIIPLEFDGEDMGVAATGLALDKPLWPVVDVYGLAEAVQISGNAVVADGAPDGLPYGLPHGFPPSSPVYGSPPDGGSTRGPCAAARPTTY